MQDVGNHNFHNYQTKNMYKLYFAVVYVIQAPFMQKQYKERKTK